MGFTVEWEGLEDLEPNYRRELDRLRARDLPVAVDHAANEGMRAVHDNHPYTDRTSNLTGHLEAIPAVAFGNEIIGEMVADMPYASYVNDKAKFEFMSKAERIARAEIEKEGLRAVNNFCDRVNRRP